MNRLQKNSPNDRSFGLTNNQLKIIAMLSMLTDHLGILYLISML